MSIAAKLLAAVLLIVSAAAAAQAAPPKFATPPTATPDGPGFIVKFAVDKATDVTIAIVDKQGKIVRRLASGVLGESAPAPFKAGKLDQEVAWDGKDDAGKPVAAAECKARVSLGLSAAFERALGDEKQAFGSINAIAVGPRGEVYVFDGGRIVVLDREGTYQRQIMPYPADIDPAKIAGLDPVKLDDGTLFCRRGYPHLKWTGSAIGQMGISPDGQMLYLPGSPRYARKLTLIGADGSVPANAFDTRLTTHADNGNLYLACSPDGKTLYMAGAEAGYMGDDARDLSYRQSVYRLRLDAGDGPAETFTGDDENSGGDGFSVDDPKGLAVNPAGHVFVCNYGGGNVAVYTPGAGFLRKYEVKHPQQVAVNPKTGQLYVLCGSQSHVYKFGYHFPSTWQYAKLVQLSAEGKIEKELTLDPPYLRSRKDEKTGQPTTQPEFNLRMAADFSEPAKPVIWVGVASPSCAYAKWGLLRIEDLGEKFSEPKDVNRKGKTSLQGAASRLAYDRKNDILYLATGGKFARYKGDGELMDFLRPVDEKGVTFKGEIAEQAIGPDGMIYFSAMGASYNDNFLCRSTPDGKLVPFEAGQPKITHMLKGGSGGSSRGFTVDARGQMYVLYYDDRNRPADKAPPEAWDKCIPLPTALAKYGADGKLLEPRLVYHLRSGSQCVRVDSKGGIYVADNFMPTGISYPAEIAKVMPNDPLKRPYPARLADATFDRLLQYMGCVLKFGPEGGQIVGLPDGQAYPPAAKPPVADLYRPAPQTQWFVFNYHNLKLTGAQWQFQGIWPMPAQYQGVSHVERCVCSAGRFDVDAFDRVFVPDGLRHRVTVLDSNGNLVCRIGQYGNGDGQAGTIGLSSPGYVTTGDDRAYIGDGRRVVQVKFTYAAEAEAAAK